MSNTQIVFRRIVVGVFSQRQPPTLRSILPAALPGQLIAGTNFAGPISPDRTGQGNVDAFAVRGKHGEGLCRTLGHQTRGNLSAVAWLKVAFEAVCRGALGENLGRVDIDQLDAQLGHLD